ncbi:MAG: L-seryl-tRNA(Sec) selenium transferase [Ruminococcus sp.]|nr:L-seryl-tRNA(Sec) selenium transferase [Ruminococcus sp.]
MDKNRLYRSIPKVDILLEDEQIQFLICKYGRDCVMAEIRTQLEELRKFIGECSEEGDAEKRIASISQDVAKRVIRLYRPHMKNVINATGTILHTNLGRAPLSEKHVEQIMGMISGYSNLEYDLVEGKRGERYAHFEELLCRITGAEAAMAVNNNAASVLLILRALAKEGEVIVSRGELVEVGGSFRIPEVMKLSGAKLIEVGATNKTHLEDYENAVTEQTKALMKVHTSNYKIVGFSESVEIKELLSVAKKYDLPLIEDLGSGVLINLERYGLAHEPTVQETLAAGTDVVCFSGDKLLGGPQAGIIVGKKKYIDKIKKNQLARALRIDKFTAAALELVLMEYLSEENVVKNIPVLRMITRPLEGVKEDAKCLCDALREKAFPAKIEVISSEAKVGGGSLPMEVIPSMAVSIIPEEISISKLEKRMRSLSVPVIGRITEQQLLLDVRTMEKKHFELIVKMFGETKIFHENCSIQ